MPAKNHVDVVKHKFWREEMQKQLSSGLSGPEYCRLQGHKYSLFADWKARLRRIDAAGGIPKSGTNGQKRHRLKKAHPAGKNPTRGGRASGRQSNQKRSCGRSKQAAKRKAVTVPPPPKTASSVDPTFAPVRLVDRSKETAASAPAVVEVVLPNALVLRVTPDCPAEFLASIVSTMSNL